MVQTNPRPDLPLTARLRQDLKNDLIAGLLVVIPLATTIWLSTVVSRFVLAFLTSVPKQLNPFITLNPLLQDLINPALGLTVPLMGILLIGLMARNIVGRWLLEFGEGTSYSAGGIGLQNAEAVAGNGAAGQLNPLPSRGTGRVPA